MSIQEHEIKTLASAYTENGVLKKERNWETETLKLAERVKVRSPNPKKGQEEETHKVSLRMH